MISELFELQAKFEEIEKLKVEFEKHLPEAHALAQQYVDNRDDYIERGLGDIVDVTENEVTFEHWGWEHHGEKTFPLELFTNPEFIKDVIKKSEEKKDKKRKEFEAQERKDYEKLKQKFGE